MEIAAAVEAFGAAGPAALVVGAVVCGLLCLPIGVWLFAAGFLFGLPAGAAVGIGIALGVALVNFAIARRLGAASVFCRLRRRAAIVRLGATLGSHGGLVLALLRLSPIVSWPVMSYAAGLSSMRWRSYLASCIGLIPLALLYAWVGALAQRVGSAEVVSEPLRTWGVPVGVLLVVVAIAIGLRAAPPPRPAAAPV